MHQSPTYIAYITEGKGDVKIDASPQRGDRLPPLGAMHRYFKAKQSSLEIKIKKLCYFCFI